MEKPQSIHFKSKKVINERRQREKIQYLYVDKYINYLGKYQEYSQVAEAGQKRKLLLTVSMDDDVLAQQRQDPEFKSHHCSAKKNSGTKLGLMTPQQAGKITLRQKCSVSARGSKKT